MNAALKDNRKLTNNELLGSSEDMYGTALINVKGVIFPDANPLLEMLGGTSLESLDKALDAAMKDDSVTNIILDIDSPGGQVTGVNAMAKKIASINKVKPVVAYSKGLIASAAYWLASAAGEIVIDDTAKVGSIGVVATLVDDGEALEKAGIKVIEITNDDSPNKRPDISTEEGQSDIKQAVNDIADIFIETVATNRGVSVDKVKSDFGKGGTFVGKRALEAGMVDNLGSLEMENETMEKEVTLDSLQAEHPNLVSELVEKAMETERSRIQSVEAQLLPGYEAMIEDMKFDGKSTGAEAALAIIKAEKEESVKVSAEREEEAVEAVETLEVADEKPELTLEEQYKANDKVNNAMSFKAFAALIKHGEEI